MVKTSTRTLEGKSKKRNQGKDVNFDSFDIDKHAESITAQEDKIYKTSLLVTYFEEDKERGKGDIINHWKRLSSTVSKYIICKEECPTTNKIHYHLFITSKSQFKINGIRRLVVPGFKWPNVRWVNKENVKWCIMYCSKSDPVPLCEGYEPIKPKISASMPADKFEKMCNERFKDEPPTEEAIKKFAHECGQSVAAIERFTKSVKSCLTRIIDQYYVAAVNPENIQPMNIPKLMDEWINAIRGGCKVPLIIKSSRVDEVYNILKTYGPHLLHKNNVDYESFNIKVDHKDAMFVVFNDVSTFNCTTSLNNRPHSVYMKNLFFGKGQCVNGREIYYNHLPVVLIDNGGHGFWKNYCTTLEGSLSIEINNFSKEDYVDILNDDNEIRNVNKMEYRTNPFRGDFDIDEYVVVRDVPSGMNIDIDDRIRKQSIPSRITKYNYSQIDAFYGVNVRSFSPKQRINEILSDNNKLEVICELLEALIKRRSYDDFYKYMIAMIFEDKEHMNLTIIDSRTWAIKDLGEWKMRKDIDVVSFDVSYSINSIMNERKVKDKLRSKGMSKAEVEWKEIEERRRRDTSSLLSIERYIQRDKEAHFKTAYERSTDFDWDRVSRYQTIGNDDQKRFKQMLEERFFDVWQSK
jgi:hypothetical protein